MTISLNLIYFNIINSIKENNLLKIKDIVEKHNVSIDSLEEGEKKPLIYALQNSNESEIYQTKNLNFEVGQDGETPLFIALKNKSYRIAKYGENIIFYLFKKKAMTSTTLNLMISKGININTRDKNGKTALIYALESHEYQYVMKIIKHYQIEEFLIYEYQQIKLDYDEDYINSNSNILKKGRTTALLTACNFYNIKAVELFIKCRANIEVKNTFGQTPLFYFYTNGYKSIIKTLIKYGANINETDNFNKTPLFKACESCQAQIVELYLKEGANPNIYAYINNQVYTPLQIAVERNYSSIVDLLLKYKSNPNTHIKYGREQEDSTLLIIATRNGNSKIVRSLLTYDAHIDDVDYHLKSGLMYARELNNIEIINIYMEFEQKRYKYKTLKSSSEMNNEKEINTEIIIEEELKKREQEKEEERKQHEIQHKKDLEFTYKCIQDHNVMLYFYSPWFTSKASKTVYVHYKIGNNRWTPLPGIPMYFSNEYSCYYIKIPLWISTTIELCFTDGIILWDNNNEHNYRFTPGCYTIKNYTVIEGKPTQKK
ncbi:ankyrin [Neocallimastix californiae]|uniref:Ankyrin n=1 Tax=Neocallimastix californiae TaxID=1754190 RepID=A0A1Y2ER45_9FUNG|nr:ankyrin [Neocallimastix californiae]|eukprot:ORY73764.1 ankyrin [Neocallimastix californiae]